MKYFHLCLLCIILTVANAPHVSLSTNSSIITMELHVDPGRMVERSFNIDSFSLCDFNVKPVGPSSIFYNVTVYNSTTVLCSQPSIQSIFKVMFLANGIYSFEIWNDGEVSIQLNVYISTTYVYKKNEEGLYSLAFTDDKLWSITLQQNELKQYPLDSLKPGKYYLAANTLTAINTSSVFLYISPVSIANDSWRDLGRQFEIQFRLEQNLELSKENQWMILQSQSNGTINIIIVFSNISGSSFSFGDVAIALVIITVLLLLLKMNTERQKRARKGPIKGRISGEEAKKQSILAATSIDPRISQNMPYTPPIVKEYLKEQKEKGKEKSS